MIVFTSSTNSGFGIDKFVDIQRANNILDLVSEVKSRKMTKLASSNQEVESALSLLVKALATMGLKVNIDIGELLKKISENQEQMVKEAKSLRKRGQRARIRKYTDQDAMKVRM